MYRSRGVKFCDQRRLGTVHEVVRMGPTARTLTNIPRFAQDAKKFASGN
jgi:hypothetical protein